MAFEYEAQVSVRVGVYLKFTSEVELSDDDQEAFAQGVAIDVVCEGELLDLHPGGVDDAGRDGMDYEGDVTLTSLKSLIAANEVV